MPKNYDAEIEKLNKKIAALEGRLRYSSSSVVSTMTNDIVDMGETPCVRVIASDASTTSLTTSTWTNIVLGTLDYDYGGYITAGATNHNPITIRRGGIYSAFGLISYAANNPAVGTRFTGLGVNWVSGSPTYVQGGFEASTQTVRCGISAIVELEVGDTITLVGWQNSGGNLSTTDPAGGVGNLTSWLVLFLSAQGQL